MKRYKWLIISLAILLSGMAFIPGMAFPWTEKIDWQSFALAYTNEPVIFYVTTTADEPDAVLGDGDCKTASDECSLRAAISEANLLDNLEADVIVDLPPGIYTLIFSDVNAHISFSRESSWNVVVRGHGAENTIIEGYGDVRLFSVYRSATFTDVTIRNGKETKDLPGGAFIINNDSMLTLKNCIVSDNQSYYGGAIYIGNTSNSFLTLENTTLKDNSAVYGGAIFNQSGTVIIRNSTISTNNAEIGGGVINDFGGQLILENSTLSGNQANNLGGAMYQGQSSHTYIYNTTVTSNIAGGHAGGVGLFNSFPGIILLSNSIIAGNQSPVAPDCYISEPDSSNLIHSSGYNLLGSTADCAISLLGSDIVASNPGLGPLQDNGGPTQTHALLQDSPAINAGNPYGCLDFDNELLTTDQRGFPRPSGVVDTRCDIGAYEWEGPFNPVFLPLIVR